MHVGIQTTQNVQINYELATVGERIIATIIDYFILFAYGIGCYFLLTALPISALPEAVSMVLLVLLTLPWVLYDLLCEIFMNGQSFGKRQQGIKVVRLDGSQPGIGSYLLRWLVGMVEGGVIRLVVVLINGKGQRLGDMAAGTTVIKIKPRVTLEDTILAVLDDDYIPMFPQVTKLSDRDASIIKDVLVAGERKDNRVATTVLYNKTKEFLGIESGLPPTVFLETVLKDYNYYTGK